MEQKMNEVISQKEVMSADISELKHQISEYEKEKIDDNVEEKADNSQANKTSDDRVIESFIVYTIQSGDTLTSICETFGLDYGEYISKIVKINNISNVNKIYTGQELYIPIITE